MSKTKKTAAERRQFDQLDGETGAREPKTLRAPKPVEQLISERMDLVLRLRARADAAEAEAELLERTRSSTALAKSRLIQSMERKAAKMREELEAMEGAEPGQLRDSENA